MSEPRERWTRVHRINVRTAAADAGTHPSGAPPPRDAAPMSEPTHLRVYRFEPDAVFEGGLLGAIERMQLGGDAKLLDALFVTHDTSTGELAAVDLPSGSAGGTFASMVDFRLDAGRRRAISERTLAAHRGGVPRLLIEEIAATIEAGAAIFVVLHTGGRGTRYVRCLRVEGFAVVREQRPSAGGARCVPAGARQAAMQMAMTTRRRSIGLAASVPYTSHPFALSVPPAGGVGRLPAMTP
jgi:hypothetical protein